MNNGAKRFFCEIHWKSHKISCAEKVHEWNLVMRLPWMVPYLAASSTRRLCPFWVIFPWRSAHKQESSWVSHEDFQNSHGEFVQVTGSGLLCLLAPRNQRTYHFILAISYCGIDLSHTTHSWSLQSGSHGVSFCHIKVAFVISQNILRSQWRPWNALAVALWSLVKLKGSFLWFSGQWLKRFFTKSCGGILSFDCPPAHG